MYILESWNDLCYSDITLKCIAKMTLYLFRSNLGLIRSIGAHDQIPNIEKNTIQNETNPLSMISWKSAECPCNLIMTTSKLQH